MVPRDLSADERVRQAQRYVSVSFPIDFERSGDPFQPHAKDARGTGRGCDEGPADVGPSHDAVRAGSSRLHMHLFSNRYRALYLPSAYRILTNRTAQIGSPPYVYPPGLRRPRYLPPRGAVGHGRCDGHLTRAGRSLLAAAQAQRDPNLTHRSTVPCKRACRQRFPGPRWSGPFGPVNPPVARRTTRPSGARQTPGRRSCSSHDPSGRPFHGVHGCRPQHPQHPSTARAHPCP